MPRIAVIGAGWAGICAAVQASTRDCPVTLFEMAPQCGGRARGLKMDGLTLDNGQHIMIGAYTELLRLMRCVGADPQRLLLRTPLALLNAVGAGLQLRPGRAISAFVWAVARHPTWSWNAKLALLGAAMQWGMSGFRCRASLDVAELTKALPAVLRDELIDPLCIAALNTPSAQASASVFLRVLQDALFAGPGAADLLLPKVCLSDVLPNPALHWLHSRGATLRRSTRIMQIEASARAWSVDGTAFDRVVIATPAGEAARLAGPIAPDWADTARRLRFEPIVTVYLSSPGTRLPAPMLALRANATRPAQFVFDRGQLGGPAGLLAFVISGAQAWVDLGAQATLDATLAQAHEELRPVLRAALLPIQLLTEKRATFRCTPQLHRPSPRIAAGLWAAGDYVDGPYPATLEGAARSGVQAIEGSD